MADFKYQYYFSARELRSFDFTANGDWSRYLLVVTQALPAIPTPAINLFTLPTQVTPKSMIHLWSALHYHYCNYDFEFGYTFWWRAKEHLSCVQNIPNNLGILDLSGLCSTTPTSASTANISQSIVSPNITVSNSTFTPIPVNGLNLDCSQSKSLSNSLYAAIGYDTGLCHDLYVGLLGSYEFGHSYTALSAWSVWGTIGLAF